MRSSTIQCNTVKQWEQTNQKYGTSFTSYLENVQRTEYIYSTDAFFLSNVFFFFSFSSHSERIECCVCARERESELWVVEFLNFCVMDGDGYTLWIPCKVYSDWWLLFLSIFFNTNGDEMKWCYVNSSKCLRE